MKREHPGHAQQAKAIGELAGYLKGGENLSKGLDGKGTAAAGWCARDTLKQHDEGKVK